jgi:glycosyltransferase involved in cell wall biosynthesis
MQTIQNRPALLIAGNFLSSKTGTRGMCEDLSDQLEASGYSVIRTSSIKNRILRLMDFLWTAFTRRNHYDRAIVELYSGLAFEWARILGAFLRLLGKPFILVLHGGKLWEFYLKNTKKVEKLLKMAASCCSPSTFLAENFSAVGIKVCHIPNGLDLGKYTFKDREHFEPKLVWLRAIHQIYNPQMAIDVFQMVSERYQDAELWMIGPDKQDGSMAEVLRKIEKLSKSERVHLVGAVPKDMVSVWLNKGDIFLNTTNFESFGVSVIEAAASGLAVVTTDAGELPRIWTNEENAILVPVGDAETMGKAVITILENPNQAMKMTQNARRRVESYQWEQVMPLWIKLIEQLQDKT